MYELEGCIIVNVFPVHAGKDIFSAIVAYCPGSGWIRCDPPLPEDIGNVGIDEWYCTDYEPDLEDIAKLVTILRNIRGDE